MTRKYYILIIIISLSLYKLYAQGQLVINQYIAAKQYYNPAAAETDNQLHISAFHTREMIGVEGASRSFVILANMPIEFIERIHNISVGINTDKFGLYQTTELSSSYSWIQRIGEININIAGGIIFRNSSFDGTKVYIPEGTTGMSQDDDLLPRTKVTGKGIDLNFGTFIYGYNAFLGLSSRNILNTNITLSERYQVPMTRYYNVILGYNYKLQEYNMRFTPSTLLSINDNLFYRADFTISSWYNDMFGIDIGYRYNSAFSVGIGTKFSNFNFGYRVTIPQSRANRLSNWGTHEFFVSYAVDILGHNSKRNIFKSIRLL